MFQKLLFVLSHGFFNVQAAKKLRSVQTIQLHEENASDYVFCFFGEFGYGLTTWLPFLNQVSQETNIKMVTCGLNGSTPFFSNFSLHHTELAIKSLDEMGNSAVNGEIHLVYDELRKRFPTQKIIFPTPGITINGRTWLNTNLHIRFNPSCGDFSHLPPLPPAPEKEASNTPRRIVINIKDYHNWQNDAIQNYYTEDDLIRIVEHHQEDEIFLNYPSLPKEDSSSGYFTVKLPQGLNIHSSYSIYDGCESIGDINKKQIELLASADVVYATQGGNAILSLLCAKEIKIIMRGGFDYPDFTYLGKKLNKKVDIFFELPF